MLQLSMMVAGLLVADGHRPALIVGRRAALTTFGAVLAMRGPCLAHASEPTAVTKMDAFQLKASYNGLSDAIQGWNAEIAMIQLGNEPSSVVAVAGLSDTQLKHFAESGSASSVESFKKSRAELLSNLFLARGAARYESDPNTARTYISKARLAAEEAQGDLAAIAASGGIEVGARRTSDAPAPQRSPEFTPRQAPPPAVRLTF